jgi:hypothetical protein
MAEAQRALLQVELSCFIPPRKAGWVASEASRVGF